MDMDEWGPIETARPNMEMCMCPLHTMFPQRIEDLVEPTYEDLKAACDLIGKDSYGKPHWAPDTISPCNNVVQAFARHRVRCAPPPQGPRP